jgi:hypothetical protein
MTHSPDGFDWDDLKHLLAVARHGSTLAAGRALGVDQSTAQRRLPELERRLGQSLVRPSGYRLTETGQESDADVALRSGDTDDDVEAQLPIDAPSTRDGDTDEEA